MCPERRVGRSDHDLETTRRTVEEITRRLESFRAAARPTTAGAES